MNPKRAIFARNLLRALALLTPALGSIACEDVDWDWEWRWWERPTRRVEPSRRTVRPERRAPRDAPAETASVQTSPSAAEEPSAAASPESLLPVEAQSGAFFQLYLVSEPAALNSSPTVERVKLRSATARFAALLLAQLYVPIGVGGGDHQHYLIYQDVDEFRAARAAIEWIDVSEPDTGAVDPNAVFQRAVRRVMDVLRSGAAPPRETVERCQLALAQSAQSLALDTPRRWAAAVLAARLTMDQMFDYGGARGFWDQAERLSAAGSIERLSVAWGRAESFDLEGDRSTAAEVCRAICDQFAPHSRAQAYQRAKSYVAGAVRR